MSKLEHNMYWKTIGIHSGKETEGGGRGGGGGGGEKENEGWRRKRGE